MSIILLTLAFIMIHNVDGSEDTETATQIWMNDLYEKIPPRVSDQKNGETREIKEKQKIFFHCWFLQSENVNFSVMITKMILSYVHPVPISTVISPYDCTTTMSMIWLSRDCHWLLSKKRANEDSYNLYFTNLTNGIQLLPLVLNAGGGGLDAVALAAGGDFVLYSTFWFLYRITIKTVGETVRATGARVKFEGHTDSINSIDIFADDTRVASGGRDSTVRIWSILGDCLHVLYGNNPLCFQMCAVSPNQAWMVAMEDTKKNLMQTDEFNLLVWNVDTAECQHTLSMTGDMYPPEFCCCWSVDNPECIGTITRIPQGETKLWNVRTGNCMRTIVRNIWIIATEYESMPYTNLAYLSSERIVWWNNYQVGVWDITNVDTVSDKYTLRFRRHDNDVVVQLVRVSANEKYLLVAMYSKDAAAAWVEVYLFSKGQLIQ